MRLAIERVLADIEIDGREIDGAEIEQGGKNPFVARVLSHRSSREEGARRVVATVDLLVAMHAALTHREAAVLKASLRSVQDLDMAGLTEPRRRKLEHVRPNAAVCDVAT